MNSPIQDNSAIKKFVDFSNKEFVDSVGSFGGRFFSSEGKDYRYKEIIDEYLLLRTSAYSTSENPDFLLEIDEKIQKKLTKLNNSANDQLKNSNIFTRTITYGRQSLGNYYVNNTPFEVISNDINLKVNTVVPLSDKMKTYLQNNPKIHGTSSTIFTVLPDTDQKMMSLSDLLKLKRAPVGGEMFLGGTDQTVVEGHTSFGQFSGGSYDFDRILNSYAVEPDDRDLLKTEEDKQGLFKDLFAAFQGGKLTQALVIATRLRQRGISLPSEMLNVFPDFVNQMKFYHLNSISSIYFLAKFVRKNKEEVQEPNFVTNLIEFTMQQEIDLSSFLSQNSLPKNSKLQSLKEFVSRNGYQLFYEPPAASDQVQETIQREIKESSLFNTSDIVVLQRFSLADPNSFLSFQEGYKKVENSLEKIRKHFELFDEIFFSKDDYAIKIDPRDQDLFDHPFGVIFMSDDHNQFFLNIKEFRAQNSLQLGKEINVIAAEQKNLHRIRSYLQRHNIKNVEVISFEAIAQIRNSKPQ